LLKATLQKIILFGLALSPMAAHGAGAEIATKVGSSRNREFDLSANKINRQCWRMLCAAGKA
jgi:hypothetical protein